MTDHICAVTICSYCFGEIAGEPQIRNGRPYHPPRGQGVNLVDCAKADKPIVPRSMTRAQRTALEISRKRFDRD